MLVANRTDEKADRMQHAPRRCVGLFLLAMLAAGPAQAADDDAAIARDLAEMLRAGRGVISSNQARINDPNLGDKGLGGKQVLQQAVAIYQKATGREPSAVDPATRAGRLLHAEMDAIAEVMDSNQATINQPGVGFKAFIPAVFGRLVSEAFNKRVPGEAEMKVTAPKELVRNRKSRPDAWENEVIVKHLQAPGWPKGQEYAATVETGGRSAFRIMVPEYYAASCLSCHGEKKGEVDITGYPKEDAKEGDLGGIISLVLFR
jgi:hypothetical protein